MPSDPFKPWAWTLALHLTYPPAQRPRSTKRGPRARAQVHTAPNLRISPRHGAGAGLPATAHPENNPCVFPVPTILITV